MNDSLLLNSLINGVPQGSILGSLRLSLYMLPLGFGFVLSKKKHFSAHDTELYSKYLEYINTFQ